MPLPRLVVQQVVDEDMLAAVDASRDIFIVPVADPVTELLVREIGSFFTTVLEFIVIVFR